MAGASGWVLISLLAALVGCGNGNGASQSSPSSARGGTGGSAMVAGAGSGGTNSSGASGTTNGPTPGSAGDDSGLIPSDSLRYACRKYVWAACKRLEECTGTSTEHNCLYLLDACPEYLFADGSSRTREGVLACAEVYRNQPCEDVVAAIPPDCATDGTLADGSPCAYSAQCQGACDNFSPGECGECIPVAQPGGACSDEIGTPKIACPTWQACIQAVCVDSPNAVYDEALPGATNCSSTNCVSGYVCARSSEAALPTCLPILGEGSPCYFSDVDDDVPRICGDGVYCGADTKCRKLPVSNEPCAPLEPFCAENHACVEGLCQGTANPGTVCDTSDDCLGGTSCECQASPCDAPVCMTLREEAESCAEAFDRCADGTECVAGSCVATDDVSGPRACF